MSTSTVLRVSKYDTADAHHVAYSNDVAPYDNYVLHPEVSYMAIAEREGDEHGAMPYIFHSSTNKRVAT